MSSPLPNNHPPPPSRSHRLFGILLIGGLLGLLGFLGVFAETENSQFLQKFFAVKTSLPVNVKSHPFIVTQNPPLITGIQQTNRETPKETLKHTPTVPITDKETVSSNKSSNVPLSPPPPPVISPVSSWSPFSESLKSLPPSHLYPPPSSIPSNPFNTSHHFIFISLGIEQAAQRYSHHLQSIECYSKNWNYTHVIIPDVPSYKFFHKEAEDFCGPNAKGPVGSIWPPSKWAIMETRHCVIYDQLLHASANPWYKENYLSTWIVMMDMDVFIVNGLRPMEYYIPPDQRIDIIAYERMHNGETAAGNYMLKVGSPHSLEYLKSYISVFFYLPDRKISSGDQGAALSHHMEWLWGYSHPLSSICRSLIQNGPLYTSCTKCSLGLQRLYPSRHILYYRRGMYFVRDFFVSALPPTDEYFKKNPKMNYVGLVGNTIDDPAIMFHGFKESLFKHWYSEGDLQCHSNITKNNPNEKTQKITLWTPQLQSSVRLMNTKELNEIFRKRAEFTNNKYPANGIDDVSHCWPFCLLETLDDGRLSKEKLKERSKKICPKEFRETKEYKEIYKELQ